jgi:hypothetical protein
MDCSSHFAKANHYSLVLQGFRVLPGGQTQDFWLPIEV